VTDFLQLLVFLVAAVNPAAAAGAPEPAGRALSGRVLGFGTIVAVVLVGGVALLADPILDGLGVEPETFRVGAGVVLLIGGALAVWNGCAPHRGPWDGDRAAIFPLGLPVLATPAALAAAVSYGADEGSGQTLAAAMIALGGAAALVALRAGGFVAATDAVARVTGGVLVAVAAGLIVSGVRAI
jgi:small neutral amino acid transporter SnatA (MarC family)